MMDYFENEARPGSITDSIEDTEGNFAFNYVFAADSASEKSVLDIGCGNGYGTEYLADRGAKLVIGIDVDDSIVSACRKRGHQRTNFMAMSATSLGFYECVFDLIIAFEVVEHLSNPRRFLAEVHRVLKPGGLFLLSTPNKSVYSPGLEHPIIVSHVKEYYYTELVELLKEKFPVVEIGGKHCINASYRTAEMRFQSSARLTLTRLLASSTLVRKLAKSVPFRFRLLLSGNTRVKTKAKDWILSKDAIESSHAFVAVCRKA